MYFAIKIYDNADTRALRTKYRNDHLNYISKSKEQILFAGPILSKDQKIEIGSHRIINLPNRRAAEKHVLEEPYLVNNVQQSPEICRWSPSIKFNWQDCPRKNGNIQYLIQAMDKANSSAIRDKLRSKHIAYQASVEHIYITRGPLLSDENNDEIGSLMIIDVPDLITAKIFIENEPFVKGNLFSNIELYGWRFGRIFDSLKI
jgi:hypothetical protein